MSSTPSSPPPAERIRFRQILDAGDPPKIEALIASAGVFSAEEARAAAALATTTLDGSETYRWLLAEAAGVLVGYVCYDRTPLSTVSFDLYWIAVAPERRGTGLAGELMQRTASFARMKRGLAIYAETSSRPAYAAARAFYLRVGFEEAASFPDFYDKGDGKIVFRLKL